MFFTNEGAYSSEEWATVDDPSADGAFPYDVGYADIHPDSLAAIRAAVEAWAAKHSALLEMACGPMSGYDMVQAGHDLWFTSEGHGAGFWDREELRRDIAQRPDGSFTDTGEDEGLPFLASLGDLLTDAAKEFGEHHVWFADHVEHGDAPFVYWS